MELMAWAELGVLLCGAIVGAALATRARPAGAWALAAAEFCFILLASMSVPWLIGLLAVVALALYMTPPVRAYYWTRRHSAVDSGSSRD